LRRGRRNIVRLFLREVLRYGGGARGGLRAAGALFSAQAPDDAPFYVSLESFAGLYDVRQWAIRIYRAGEDEFIEVEGYREGA